MNYLNTMNFLIKFDRILIGIPTLSMVPSISNI